MYVNGEEVFLPRIRTRHVSQSNPQDAAALPQGDIASAQRTHFACAEAGVQHHGHEALVFGRSRRQGPPLRGPPGVVVCMASLGSA